MRLRRIGELGVRPLSTKTYAQTNTVRTPVRSYRLGRVRIDRAAALPAADGRKQGAAAFPIIVLVCGGAGFVFGLRRSKNQ